MNKEKTFNFNLDDDDANVRNTKFLDLVDPKPIIDIEKQQNNLDQEKQAEFNLDIKNRVIKNVRLQVDITNELDQAMRIWMKKNKVHKKTDAVEALLRFSLGLKQRIY